MSLLSAVEAVVKFLALFLVVSLFITLLLGGADSGYTVKYANGTSTVARSAPVSVDVAGGWRGPVYTLNLTIQNRARAPVSYVLVELSCQERLAVPVWLPDPLPPGANTTVSLLLPRACEHAESETVAVAVLADGTVYVKR